MTEKKHDKKTTNLSTPHSNYDYLTAIGYFTLLAGFIMIIAFLFPITLPLAAASKPARRIRTKEEKEQMLKAMYNQQPDPAIERNAKFYPDDMKKFLQEVGLMRKLPDDLPTDPKPPKTVSGNPPKIKKKKQVKPEKINIIEKNTSDPTTNTQENNYFLWSAVGILSSLVLGILYHLPKRKEVKKPSQEAMVQQQRDIKETPEKIIQKPVFQQNTPHLFQTTKIHDFYLKPPIQDQTLIWLNQKMSFLSLKQEFWFKSQTSDHCELKLHDTDYKDIPRDEIKQLIQALFAMYDIQVKHNHSAILVIEKTNIDQAMPLPFNPHDAISLRKNLISKINPQSLIKDYGIKPEFVLYDDRLYLHVQFERADNRLMREFTDHCQHYGNRVQYNQNVIMLSINHLKAPLPKPKTFSFQEHREIKQKSGHKINAEPSISSFSR